MSDWQKEKRKAIHIANTLGIELKTDRDVVRMMEAIASAELEGADISEVGR